ncbi:TPA: DUF6575 domain-containing protein [Staphylococcus aureus]
MTIVFSKLIDVFDEFMYPTFFSYEAIVGEKTKIFITLFAYYDENSRKDYFFNVPVNKKKYEQLINGEIEIRSLFVNNKDGFFTEGSPESVAIIEPIHLNVNTVDYLPEKNLFMVYDDEFLIVDIEEMNSELDNSETVEKLFDLNIGKQINSSEYNNKEGLMIAFSNDNQIIKADSLGVLITKTSELFNKISNNLLNLNVVKPFESSFGISLEFDSLNLDINDNEIYINKFLNLLNFVSNDKKEDFFNEFLGLYSIKEKDEFLNILNELSSNDIEMKSMYYNNINGIYKGSILKPSEAKKFINRVYNTTETKETLNINNATIYKIDVKNNSFGVIIDNDIYTGKLGESLQDKEETQFTVPLEKNVVLTQIFKKDEFTKKERKHYILESIN